MAAGDRKKLLAKIEKMRNSRALLYVTGDRPGQETIIHQEVLDHFVDHLDAIGVTLRLWVDPEAPDTERACCSPEAVWSAGRRGSRGTCGACAGHARRRSRARRSGPWST